MDEPIDDLLAQGRDEEVKARIALLLQQPAQTPMPPAVAVGVLEAIIGADRVVNTPAVVTIQRNRNWRFIAACAAVVILTLGAGYFWFNTPTQIHTTHQQVKKVNKTVKDRQPGGNKAILTLADGSVINLDSINNGTIATQGKTAVYKNAGGELEYRNANSPLTTDHSPAFNTIATPNGGQYQIVLPDGSRVWLNAASSIRFPTSFTRERTVTMTGEAYFEVAHNANMPFIVNIPPQPGGPGGATVEVLGTHFNINAYNNESAIRTTLLQGSVKMVKGKGQKAAGREEYIILKPGEQAVIADNSPLTIDHSPNLEQVVAWKNGLFNLAGADLKDFMHQVERWYDVQVQYESTVPNMEFQGKLNRAVPLSDIIDYLKNLGITCKLEGKTLFVKSK
jgi:ferric-dicitrate binding protein FerR (iron transport regulator)